MGSGLDGEPKRIVFLSKRQRQLWHTFISYVGLFDGAGVSGCKGPKVFFFHLKVLQGRVETGSFVCHRHGL